MLDAFKPLPDDPAKLKGLVSLMGEEIKSQTYQIEKLKGQLAAHQKARFGSKSETLDQLAFDLSEDKEIEAAAETQKQDDPAHGDAPDQPTKRKHSRKPLPDHLDRVDEVLCQSRRKKGPFAGVKVGQLRCRALLGVLPIKLTRDKAHVGQRPTSIKFRPGSGSGVSALF